MKISLVLFLLLLFFTGCFRRFTMTEKQVKEHYREKTVKPEFHLLQNDSVKLFCATAGSDTLPPLLLIHGAPGGWFGYLGILDDSLIRAHYQVISVDRPGYHYSRYRGKRKAVTSITKQAEMIHEALRLNHSAKPGIVLGSSYGGPIAAKMTLLYPDAFHRAILLAPAIDPGKEKFWWFSPVARFPLTRIFLPHFLNAATDEKYAHIRELKKMLPEWKKIRVPVTVVQGNADQIVNPQNLDFAKAHLSLPEDEFILVPGAGHLIRRQRPDLVRSIILFPDSPAAHTGFTLRGGGNRTGN